MRTLFLSATALVFLAGPLAGPGLAQDIGKASVATQAQREQAAREYVQRNFGQPNPQPVPQQQPQQSQRPASGRDSQQNNAQRDNRQNDYRRDDRRDNNGGWNRSDRNDYRNDNRRSDYRGTRRDYSGFRDYRRAYNAPRRYRVEPYRRPSGWYARRWTFGEYLPAAFWAASYWLSNYNSYDLPPPPYGTVWVRNGDDALLIDRDSGEIISVQYGVFY